MTRDDALPLATTVGANRPLVPRQTLRPESVGRAPRSASGRGPATLEPDALPALPLGGPEGSVGEFARVRELGRGGMGVVELARQRTLSRDVAVKRLRPGFEADERSVRGLLAEAAFTGFLEHPSIVPVHSVGRDGALGPLIVMKRVEGVTLGRLLEEPDHPAWSRARGDRLGWLVETLVELTHAVEFAHSRGVLHRDIKPDNVMVGAFGEVYLLDWGVALRVDEALSLPAGAIAGTPSFLAPEMLAPERGQVGLRTDVYLLGATLHAMLTGGAPRHEGSSLPEVFAVARLSEPMSYGSEVPAELGAIANRATAALPEDRFADCAELRDALEAWRSHRASSELTEASLVELARLRELADEGAEPERVLPVFHACRFGLEQALRGWPDNDVAHTARRDLFERTLRFELARKNLGAARALAAELASVPPEVEQQLVQLAAELAAEAERRARFERALHEHDPQVSARQRALVFRGLGVVAALMSSLLLGLDLTGAVLPPPIVMVFGAIPVTLGVFAALVAYRQVFLRTRINRLIALSVVVGGLGVILHRITGVLRGESVRSILSGDALVLAVVFAFVAISIRSVFVLPAAYLVVASFVGSVAPPISLAAVGLAVLLSIATVFGAGRRATEPLVGEVFGTDEPREPNASS
jgi:serine/threonine protein kinase